MLVWMADTLAQREAALWLTSAFLPVRYGAAFSRQDVPLNTGGIHSFAAVSSTGTRVGSVCTGTAKTTGGKTAAGKLTKVRADLYFLLLAKCDERFLIFTDPGMHDLLIREQNEFARVPRSIELILAPLPRSLAERVHRAQSTASAEVSVA